MDIKETREEIIRRSKIMRKQQQKRIKRALEGVTVALMALLVVVISQAPIMVNSEMVTNYYGTLLLGKEAGIYIIIGLICFILGVTITLITIKYRDRDNSDSNADEHKD